MINIEKKDKIDILSFSIDKINALVTEEIYKEVLTVLDKSNPKLIIDLTGVEYIDSSGFGCFLSVMKAARSNYGILKFANPVPRVMDLFITLHLQTVFIIYDNIEECIRSFK